MTDESPDHVWGLSDKERQTLRLIVQGHDAKSIAGALGLSVHTINERLREARRKMAVSSSREAARMLARREHAMGVPPSPDSFGDSTIGADGGGLGGVCLTVPDHGAGRAFGRPAIIATGLFMTLALALLALLGAPQIDSTGGDAPAQAKVAAEAADFARHWLDLLDQRRWTESYRTTSRAFQRLNTPETWAETSEAVRVPLGGVISRSVVGIEDLPAPPNGYRVVRFRTRFANRPDAIETVSLSREAEGWRVAGVTIG